MNLEWKRDAALVRSVLLWGGGFIAFLIWSYHGTQGNLSGLFSEEAATRVAAYVRNLFPPDLSLPLLAEAAWGMGETFAISFLGTLFAVAIATPLALMASSTLTYTGLLFVLERPPRVRHWMRVGLYWIARVVANLFRTVPELLWALIFVFVTGLGPFPGVLALGIHTGGILGKLFAETIENVDIAPIEALQSTGASRLQLVLYGIMPQVLPHLVSYTLYRWEVNIRAAAILGFVGAGGLGQRIHIALNLFWEQQLLTYLISLYLLVTAVDALSAFLRRKTL